MIDIHKYVYNNTYILISDLYDLWCHSKLSICSHRDVYKSIMYAIKSFYDIPSVIIPLQEMCTRF